MNIKTLQAYMESTEQPTWEGLKRFGRNNQVVFSDQRKLLVGARVEQLEHNYIKVHHGRSSSYHGPKEYDTAPLGDIEVFILKTERPFDHFDTEIQCEEVHYD